jgi:DNA-binding CsgD family transcriptional regulator/N-acetylneuraminic acid mutarotase
MTDKHDLSSRELEILEHIATGASNKEIAEQLSISANTVKVHLKNIYSKIGVTSRTEAALYAIRNNLFSEDDIIIPEARSTFTEGRSLDSGSAEEQARRPQFWNLTLAMVGIVLLGIVGMFIILQLDSSPSEPEESLGLGPASERLHVGEQMLTPRSSFAIVNHENKLFTIGGKGEGGITGKVERFDPRVNEWIELPPKPTPVVDVQAAVVGGMIYVPGGFVEDEGPINALEVFNPQTGAWEIRASMPVPLSAYALAEFEGKIYVFGGWDGEKYSDIALVYDPQLDAWNELSPMPTPRGYAGGAEAGGTLFVIGGYNGTDAVSVNEAYSPQLENGVDNPWRNLEPLPDPRYGFGIANVADILHVVGGVGQNNRLNSYKYVPNLNEWQGFDFPTTESWSNFNVVQFETDLYLVGGLYEGEPTGRNLRFQVMFSVLLPVVQ